MNIWILFFGDALHYEMICVVFKNIGLINADSIGIVNGKLIVFIDIYSCCVLSKLSSKGFLLDIFYSCLNTVLRFHNWRFLIALLLTNSAKSLFAITRTKRWFWFWFFTMHRPHILMWSIFRYIYGIWRFYHRSIFYHFFLLLFFFFYFIFLFLLCIYFCPECFVLYRLILFWVFNIFLPLYKGWAWQTLYYKINDLKC